MADDGIIGFVSNSAFLDTRQDDGFRKVVAQEFNELWVLDLKGNARTSESAGGEKAAISSTIKFASELLCIFWCGGKDWKVSNVFP